MRTPTRSRSRSSMTPPPLTRGRRGMRTLHVSSAHATGLHIPSAGSRVYEILIGETSGFFLVGSSPSGIPQQRRNDERRNTTIMSGKMDERARMMALPPRPPRVAADTLTGISEDTGTPYARRRCGRIAQMPHVPRSQASRVETGALAGTCYLYQIPPLKRVGLTAMGDKQRLYRRRPWD